jgi:hypothetical protein
MDLLLHEVPVLALLGSHGIPGDRVNLRLYRIAVERLHTDVAAGDHRHLPRLEEYDAAGMLHDGWCVAGDVVLAVTEPDHHTTGVPQPRRHDLSAWPQQQTTFAPRTLNAAGRPRNPGRAESAPPVHDGFGVGIRVERDTFRGEFILQLQEVLDDPVVDHHYALRLPHVRMRVARRRGAVGRPARMTDPRRAADGRPIHQFDQLGQLACVLADFQLPSCTTARPPSHSLGIQPSQTIEDNRRRVSRADISDDSTHEGSLQFK